MNLDAVKRAWRSFLQGFVGVLALQAIKPLSELITNAGEGAVVIDFELWYSILVAGIAGGIISLISFGQNWAEDKAGGSLPIAPK